MSLLQRALLDAGADALYHGVVLVLGGVVSLLEAYAKEATEGLPEAGAERAQEGLHDVVAALVGLSVDELDEHFTLIFGHFFHRGLVLFKQLFLKGFHVLLLFLLVLVGAHVLIGLEQRGADKLGIGERAFHVAHGFPVELLLLLVAETFARVDGDVVKHQHGERVACLGLDEMIHAIPHVLQCRGHLNRVDSLLCHSHFGHCERHQRGKHCHQSFHLTPKISAKIH